MLRLIDELAAGGKTVLMSAHLLLEAEGLADQVVTMEQGRDVVTGRPDDLVRRFFPRPMVAFDAEDRAALDRLAHLPGVTGYTRDGGAGGAIVTVDDLSRVPALVAELVSAGVRLTEVTPHHPSLEQLYLKVRNGRDVQPEAHVVDHPQRPPPAAGVPGLLDAHADHGMAALFFVVIPTGLLFGIQPPGRRSHVQTVSTALDLLPQQAQEAVAGQSPADKTTSPWPSICSPPWP